MPNYDNLYNKALQQLRSGDRKGALQGFLKCAKHKNYRLQSLKMCGNICGELAAFDDAERYYSQAVKLAPRDAELYCFIAKARTFAGKPHENMLTSYRSALAIDPNNLDAMHGVGSIQFELAQYDEAVATLSSVLERRPDHLHARLDLAKVLRVQGEYEQAMAHYDEAVRLHPASIDALSGRALLMFYGGEVEQAAELIRSYADRFRDNPVIATAYAQICTRSDFRHDAMRYLVSTLNNANIATTQRMNMQYIQARLYDSMSEYDKAFVTLQQANKSTADLFGLDAFMQSIPMSKYVAMTPLPSISVELPSTDIMPVFILGMPRSGSSLIEQVLSCHPDVSPAGELTSLYKYFGEALEKAKVRDLAQLPAECLVEVGQRYIEDITAVSDGKSCVTDKLPGNFERISVINTLFPQAKIINTVRNRLDVCVSCLFQNFGTRHLYTADQSALATVYQYYDEVISFWKQHSGIPIQDIVYEQLVTEPESEIRTLLEYIGLSWNDACLSPHQSKHVAKTASNDQVRQPLYNSSIGRWQRYEAHIKVLKNALASSA